MPLFFNALLRQFDIDPRDVRLLRHKDGRSERGRTPYELWKNDRSEFVRYQAHQTFENRSRLTPAAYWASFVVTPMGETLFAGLYIVSYCGILEQDSPWPHAPGIDFAGSCDTYDLKSDVRTADVEGCIAVDWGSGTRTWIQRADLQNKSVVELRREFKEPEFPGFTKFLSPLSRIENLPQSWTAALKAAKGIYLLTCPREGLQYVGSATGEDGFWGRWLEYSQNGHGGNVGLRNRELSDYEVSILEVAGSGANRDDILETETVWKTKLRSREMGLNRN